MLKQWERFTVKREDEQELFEAVRHQKKGFDTKILWLKRKWHKIACTDEYPVVRQISRALFQTSITPITGAIIMDNIDYLNKNYAPLKEVERKNSLDEQERQKLLKQIGKNLFLASVCGSQNVAKALLEQFLALKAPNTSPDELNAARLAIYDDFMLSYVGASPNEEWAKAIAIEMQQAGMRMPLNVHSLYVDSNVSKQIQEIFEKGLPKPKINMQG